MRDPEQLFELADDIPEIENPPLIRLFDGFIDAGGAGRLAREHLLTTLDSVVVATFDGDLLHDYRSRRPVMTFVEDTWTGYDGPTLELRAMWDAAGTPFLLLGGPEPDVQWERFVDAVELLVSRFEVRLTVGINGIPMGVPHTRPTSLTAHGTRPELVAGHTPWLGKVQVPASVGNLLEYRLGQQGHDAMGFAIHVPHYLAQSDYPAAAEVALDAVARATGLVLPTDALQTAAAQVRTAIDEQVAESAEVGAVVAALERQYDAIVGGRGSNLLDDGSRPLPTAEELGAELERFLAEQTREHPPEQ